MGFISCCDILYFGIGALLLLLGSGELFRGEEDASVSVSTEDRLAELCSAVDGAGRCTAMMSYGSDGEVTAVALLCDGAEIPRVRESLTKLICSLYSIGANRVAIVKRA